MTVPEYVPSDADLIRYLAGNSGLAESRGIEQWLDAAAGHRGRLDELALIVQATAPTSVDWDPARSWDRLAPRLEPRPRPIVVRDPPRLHRRWWPQAALAAGLAAAIFAGLYAVRPLSSPHASGAADAVASSIVERRTARGERAAFRLPDGTGVMLGPASRLRYSVAAYGRSQRDVELEGDGYFDVLHDDAHPFAVRTATAVVRDLGTRFVIRTHPDVDAMEVGVAEGRVVAVPAAAPRDSVHLGAGDAARLANAERPVVQHGVNVDRYLAWTEGRLVFERAPLSVVVGDLERWYDIDIELAGTGLDRRLLTAAFRDKPATEVLGLIAASLDLTVSGSGKRFALSAR